MQQLYVEVKQLNVFSGTCIPSLVQTLNCVVMEMLDWNL